MNKKACSIFRKIAAGMPPVNYPEKVRVTGAEILAANPGAVNENGEPIFNDMYYHVILNRPRNHYKAMKKIYSESGLDAVKKYFKDVMTLHKEATQATIDMDLSLMDRIENAKPFGI